MYALTLPKVGEVEYREVPEPTLINSTDVILQVWMSAICGSDLHAYHGRIGGIDPNVPVDHEYVGVVVAAGKDVKRFKVGDRVTGSFFSACGECWYCRHGLYSQCDHVALFGFGTHFGSLAGTQAERVRIPFADYTLVHVPSEVSNEAALFAGDILSTAYFCVQRAGIVAGDSVAVVGLGPVGLLAVEMAYAFGAARVFALDMVEDRLHRAEVMGAVAMKVDSDVVKEVRQSTAGRGVDKVIEAVGREESLKLAIQLARGFGTISSAGVYTERTLGVSMGRIYAKDLTLKAGMANIPSVIEPVMELIRTGRVHPEQLVTHRFELRDGAQAYQLFDRREALKVLLTLAP